MQIDKLKKAIDKITETKDFNILWISCSSLFTGSLLWKNVLRMKNEMSVEHFLKFLSAFGKLNKRLNNVVKEALKNKDYAEIARITANIILRNIIDVKKQTLGHSEKELIRTLPDKLGPTLARPFLVLEKLAHGQVSASVNNLKAKQLKQYLALFIAIWVDILDILDIEELIYLKNPKREKRIKELVLESPKLMSQYYDLIEADPKPEELIKVLKKMIRKDPDFFDPYLALAGTLDEKEEPDKAYDIRKEAFRKAMLKIVDKKGNWPEEMPWGFLENRHLIRALVVFARELWEQERYDFALYLYRKLLKTNPNDNIGARYEILAIQLGLDPDYAEEMFPASMPNTVDAIKSEDWFQENAKKFPEDFNWWFKVTGE